MDADRILNLNWASTKARGFSVNLELLCKGKNQFQFAASHGHGIVQSVSWAAPSWWRDGGDRPQWPTCQGLQTKNCTHTLQLSICSNLVENFTVFSNQSFRVTFIKIPWLRPAAIKLLIILCKELSVDWVRSGVMFYDSYLNIVNHHHVSKLSGTVSVWVEQRNVWPRPRPASISRMLNVNNGNII